jgi:uncharacterized protein (DUF427 family)
MALQMSTLMGSVLGELRIHPVQKWVRASVGNETVIDSRRAMLVWEPSRVVPSYAVPVEDVDGALVPYDGDAGEARPVRMGRDGPSVLDPRTPFTVHSSPGAALSFSGRGTVLPGSAFAPHDAELSGYVVLDWGAFDQWYEEEEPVIGHPHDPFDRIDCLPSSRHLVVAMNGQVLADSRRPTLLFETPLPVRYYLPPEDVNMDLLQRSSTRTVCAYKGSASYWSMNAEEASVPDIAWSYEDPLHDALPVRGMISFFTERTDLTIDGEATARPMTPWS